ncbi:MAG: hypothetical protein Q8930_08595 [Bacillota bacterium]|nr:hypothetical protein [Bacillota bacterium]
MKDAKLHRLVFTLLRVFGVLWILGEYFGSALLFGKNVTVIGHAYIPSPVSLIVLIVSITVYLVIIRVIAKATAPKTN